ncbi:MAG: GNAT family N-acetyltransferase [Thermoanaerobaculia bacterium]
MKIRPVEQTDRRRIAAILAAVRIFTSDEIEAAMAQVIEAINTPRRGRYLVDVADSTVGLVGYVSYGPTPRYAGTWDLYWIAVDPEQRNRGIGSLLLEHVEKRIRELKGETLLIETSAAESYEPTRRFYQRNGYRPATRVMDFARLRADRIIYSRRIGGTA